MFPSKQEDHTLQQQHVTAFILAVERTYEVKLRYTLFFHSHDELLAEWFVRIHGSGHVFDAFPNGELTVSCSVECPDPISFWEALYLAVSTLELRMYRIKPVDVRPSR